MDSDRVITVPQILLRNLINGLIVCLVITTICLAV
jgi:hypothetical protein